MKRLLSIILFMLATSAYADPFVVGQTAGYSGLLAGGGGYSWKYFSTSIMGGHTPKLLAGEELWSATIKNQLQNGVFHIGMAAHFSFDHDTFWKLPSKYPRRYYPPSGIKTGPYMGVHVDFEPGIGLFTEVHTLDYYLELKARNPDYVMWTDIISVGMGFYYTFKDEP